MERIKEKLLTLRGERDAALEQADEAVMKNKKLEEALLQREQEIKSKDHRLDVLEKQLEETSARLKDTTEKLGAADVAAEHTDRQLKRIEQERDIWEKKCEEAQQKYRKAQAELDDLVANMDNL
ncbi:hypothetical protein EI94DRAFT_1827516 [Lactarius quietus]|nr:hypothetical protein EI94DRAFT_1827516 [Lactarius quietus]